MTILPLSLSRMLFVLCSELCNYRIIFLAIFLFVIVGRKWKFFKSICPNEARRQTIKIVVWISVSGAEGQVAKNHLSVMCGNCSKGGLDRWLYMKQNRSGRWSYWKRTRHLWDVATQREAQEHMKFWDLLETNRESLKNFYHVKGKGQHGTD